MNLKKVVLVILIILFITFYVGYSFSKRGNIVYSTIQDGRLIPSKDTYTTGDNVEVSFTLNSQSRKRSLFKPLLKSQLKISTYLKDVKTHAILLNRSKRIRPDEIKEGVFEGQEYYTIFYDLPLEENRELKVYLNGTVPKGTRNTLFAGAVQVNHYFLDKKDYYKNSIKKMVEK